MAGGGGAWKVAYADFVTAMMAFFLVMWITSQGQDVKQAIAGYFQDPWGTSTELQAPASLLPSEMHGDAQSLTMPEKLPHGKKPGIADSDEKNADARAQSRWAQNRRVHFIQDTDHTSPAQVLQFDETSAELSKQSIEQLNRLLPVLVGKQNRIEIRGHTTRRPLPSDSPYHDLWQLAYARSAETMNYLERHGVEPERLRLSQAGAYEPITNRIESAWQKENSRVEIFLLSEMADDVPGTQTSTKAAGEPEKPSGKQPSAKPNPTASTTEATESAKSPPDTQSPPSPASGTPEGRDAQADLSKPVSSPKETATDPAVNAKQ
jgi:chemotaxis protein MotB